MNGHPFLLFECEDLLNHRLGVLISAKASNDYCLWQFSNPFNKVPSNPSDTYFAK